MLPKKRRIQRSDFGQILKTGKSVSSSFLSFKYTRADLFQTSFSVVVSKAVSKKAVERNKLKRRIYAVITKLKNRVAPGYRAAFFIKKEAGTLSYKRLEEETVAILAKTALLI